jgi:phosphatidylserine decarboxylase
MLKISIRLGLLDNHIQRTPIEGVLKSQKYIHGEFLNLSSEKASELNEQNRTLFENNKYSVVTNQIAGFITRRIINFSDEGSVKLGQRFGMIMFGSQVDIYVPKEIILKVIVGEKVKAGETLLGLISK